MAESPAGLQALAALAVPRETLRAEGYLPLVASSDLFRRGYTVRHLVRLADSREVLEYLPRLSDLPRLTADCYGQQAAIHLALGLNLVPPGERWADFGGAGLFDAQLLPADAPPDAGKGA